MHHGRYDNPMTADDLCELDSLLEVFKKLPNVTSVSEQTAARLNAVKITLKLPGGSRTPHDPAADQKPIAVSCSQEKGVAQGSAGFFAQSQAAQQAMQQAAELRRQLSAARQLDKEELARVRAADLATSPARGSSVAPRSAQPRPPGPPPAASARRPAAAPGSPHTSPVSRECDAAMEGASYIDRSAMSPSWLVAQLFYYNFYMYTYGFIDRDQNPLSFTK